MFEVDEEGIVSGRLGDVDYLATATDLYTESSANLSRGSEGDEIVTCN